MKSDPHQTFTQTAPLPLQQHPLYGKALALLGRLAETVPLEADGQLLGQAQVVWRDMGPLGPQGLIARGPVFQAGDAAAQASALRNLAESGLRMIEAEAHSPALGAAGYIRLLTGAHIAELPLTGNGATRRARAHPKWRASHKRAQNAGLTLRHQPFRGEADHWLLLREAQARRAKGYQGLPATLPIALAQADKHALRLFWAEIRGLPVAGMLFARHGAAATYLTGWTGPLGRAACAHHLILTTAADWLAARGHIRLDLGQIDTHAAPGLARFKLGCGATHRQLGGSWLRLPGFGKPRRKSAGKPRAAALHRPPPHTSAPGPDDQNDPATLRGQRPSDDRSAAHHRPGA